MKKLILVLYLFLFCLSTQAEVKLVIWLKDGNQLSFALSERPMMLFDAYYFKIYWANGAQSINVNNVAKYTFEGLDDAGFRNLEDDRLSTFQFDGELLLFSKLKAGSTVMIHAVGGAVVISKVIEATGDYSFPISHLDKGVYLVSADGLTYKIMKK